jgi:undecaprenyl-diphosphatase
MNINSELFLDINGLAGNGHAFDQIIIFCASYLVYIIIAIAVALMAYLVYKREWKTVVWFVGALAASFVILKIAQYIHPGVRPFTAEKGVIQLIKHAPGTSFPSDHTTITAAIAFAFIFITRYKTTGWLLLLGAAIVGFARIVAGVHYPFDILAGLGTGLIGAGIIGIIRAIVTPKDKSMVFDDHAGFKS